VSEYIHKRRCIFNSYNLSFPLMSSFRLQRLDMASWKKYFPKDCIFPVNLSFGYFGIQKFITVKNFCNSSLFSNSEPDSTERHITRCFREAYYFYNYWLLCLKAVCEKNNMASYLLIVSNPLRNTITTANRL